jgi:hypothetical protein
MEAAEKIVYPYAWGMYNVLVLPASFPYGGMENPIFTFATPTIISKDRQNVDVIAHELSHSWSGNLVSNASWEHFCKTLVSQITTRKLTSIRVKRRLDNLPRTENTSRDPWRTTQRFLCYYWMESTSRLNRALR